MAEQELQQVDLDAKERIQRISKKEKAKKKATKIFHTILTFFGIILGLVAFLLLYYVIFILGSQI